MSIAHTFYFNDGPYLQALKACFKAAVSPETIVLLTGENKTGKSRLSEKLTQLLRKKGFRTILLGADINSPELLRNFLARELDLPQAANFTRLLESSLDADNKQPLILIFDDADQLSDTTLMEIHMLCEAQQHDRRMLNAVLCGEPSLARRLAQKIELKKLQLQINARVELPTMTADETRQFMYSYANKAGSNGLLIDPAAANYLQRTCKGFPGPTLEIARALLLRRAENAEQSPVLKQELVGLVRSLPVNNTIESGSLGSGLSLRQGLLPLAAVVVVASLGLLYQQLLAPAPDGEAEVASASSTQAVVFSDQVGTTDSTEPDATPLSASALEADDASEPDSVQNNLVTDTSVGALASPEDAIATVATDENAQDAGATAQETQFTAAAQAEQTDQAEEEVSDSGLLLVTAEERGIDSQDIVAPEYEAILLAQEAAAAPVDADASAGDDSQAAASEANNTPVTTTANNANRASVAGNDDASAAAPVPDVAQEAVTVAAVEPEQIPEPEATPEPAAEPAGVATLADNGVAEEPARQDSVAQAATLAAADTEADNLELLLQEVLAGAVNAWVDSWQAQDLDGYFASYHSAYEPSYHDTRAQWTQDRRRIIGNARDIEIDLSEFAVIEAQGDTIEVQFWLAYASPTYRDDTLKKLLLRNEAGQWKIVEETNLVVRR